MPPSQPAPPPSAGRTASPQQAALLLDPRLNDLLSELVRLDSASASELARALGRPLSSVHAQLERLLVAGIVEVAAVQARAGRPIRRYRMPLPWHVPFAVTPAATLRELLGGGFETGLSEQLDALARVMGHAESQWEVLVERLEGQLSQQIRPLRRSEMSHLRAAMGSGVNLRLVPARSLELKERLTALIQEFMTQPDEDGQRWTLTVLLTPDDEALG